MKRIQGVIFDLDGTLIDSLDTYNLAFNRVAERLGLSPVNIRDMKTFLNQFISLEQLLQELYPATSARDRECFIQEMRAAFTALSKDHITLQPYARELLTDLKLQDMKIGVATGRMSVGIPNGASLRTSASTASLTQSSPREKPSPNPTPQHCCSVCMSSA